MIRISSLSVYPTFLPLIYIIFVCLFLSSYFLDIAIMVREIQSNIADRLHRPPELQFANTDMLHLDARLLEYQILQTSPRCVRLLE